MRRSLHREVSVPALYIYATDDPVEVTVRVHDKNSLTGDIPGLAVSHTQDIATHIRFWRDELSLPRRGAKLSIEAGVAYILGEATEPYGDTIDVSATRLSAVEAAGLPLPVTT